MAFDKTRNTFARYYGLNRWMLECCGVLPLAERGIFVNVFFIFTALFSASFLVLPVMYMIAFHSDDIEATEIVNTIAGASLEVWVGALKVIAMLPCRPTTLSLFRRAAGMWSLIGTEADLAVVQPYTRRGLYLTYGFGGVVMFAVTEVLLAPVFMRDEYDANGTILASKSLPYSVGILHENKLVFNLWWALQWPTGFLSMLSIIAIDTATSALVLYACAHLRLLSTRFRQIEQEVYLETGLDDGSKRNRDMERKYRTMFVECIGTHQEIIRLCEEIEEVFRIVVLIQMILSMSAICGFGFNLLASLNVAMEVFNIKWYNWAKEDLRLVDFTIMRSQKPLILTAGKFVDMSLLTFSSILSSAFSFFSILRKTL